MLKWLTENGLPDQGVTIQTLEKEGQPVDIIVATKSAKPGDTVLRVPEHLIVTLDSVFEDGGIAELLTTGKLSEIACLTLYLAYEKKKGKKSFFYPYIKELDRQAGRGTQGAKTPLLWDEGQVEEYLAGSPVVGQIKERLSGIEKEYEELDTVFYMSKSMFKNYSLADGFEPPTEQFPLKVFREAFAAVSSSVVHLQGVAESKRFALVPLGPPLLTYSSTCRALLKYDASTKEVQLAVDREVTPGQPIVAWCGPQPNSRLLINYGVVDPDNPHDKLVITITIPSSDPLYRLKMTRLSGHQLSTQQAFQLTKAEPLPDQLLPYMRLVNAATEEDVRRVVFNNDTSGGEDGGKGGALSVENESMVLAQLITCLKKRLSGYKTTIEEDDAIIADPTSGPRRTVAAKLLKIEKTILQGSLKAVLALPNAEAAARSLDASSSLPRSSWAVKIE